MSLEKEQRMSKLGDPGYPYGEMDAKKWTEEFFRLHGSKLLIDLDEGTMLSWFANAIMTGYDTAKREEDERAMSTLAESSFGSFQRETRLEALVRRVKHAAEHPLPERHHRPR